MSAELLLVIKGLCLFLGLVALCIAGVGALEIVASLDDDEEGQP